MEIKSEISQEENDLTIKITKENYTLDDLRQKLINDLYKRSRLSDCKNEIDLLCFLYSASCMKD